MYTAQVGNERRCFGFDTRDILGFSLTFMPSRSAGPVSKRVAGHWWIEGPVFFLKDRTETIRSACLPWLGRGPVLPPTHQSCEPDVRTTEKCCYDGAGATDGDTMDTYIPPSGQRRGSRILLQGPSPMPIVPTPRPAPPTCSAPGYTTIMACS
jgi:hypothetical protein